MATATQIETDLIRSLPEAYKTVRLPSGRGFRRFLAFFGPGLMVSVGYMDPGNWGTDMAGGSQFGFALLWVIFLSNLMAQLLQVLCVRLGLVTGDDLAMACRKHYRRPVAIALWLLCEVAIIACDLAEVIGAAVALNLLFGIPLLVGVVITSLDVLLLLWLTKFGFRKLEAIVATLVFTIFACFGYEIFLAQPEWGAVAKGMIPSMPSTQALLVSLGILGATVMPHNLYLHSSIVQTRKTGDTPDEIQSAIRYNTWDTVISLSLAFFVNAAILILAGTVFGGLGKAVEELDQGHVLLRTALGGASATAFAVALLASGQSSTITGTLAGQIVMEGFTRWKIAPWKRRLLTRSLAIIPAFAIIAWSGGSGTINLLVMSQVVLSMQLPFAIFPLIAITSNRKAMGSFVNPIWMTVLGYATSVLITGLNVFLLWDKLGLFGVSAIAAGVLGFAMWVQFGYSRREAVRVS